jgi:hypothetical protein
MAFYDLDKIQRKQLANQISQNIQLDIKSGGKQYLLSFFSDSDTYIRKNAYLATGRIYNAHEDLKKAVIQILDEFILHPDEKVRQTTVNAAGEIGIKDFPLIESLMETALFDPHHIVRNAVIGSIKKMGERNPVPVLLFANKYLHHQDKEIRREICHGIELRGRTHPEDILPLLNELQWDDSLRVRNTLVHVLGQISYKKGCLETVIANLPSWENKDLVQKALSEIIDVHQRYKNFSYMCSEEAKTLISSHFTLNGTGRTQ